MPSPERSSFALHSMNIWSHDTAISADIYICAVCDSIDSCFGQNRTAGFPSTFETAAPSFTYGSVICVSASWSGLFNLMVEIDACGRVGWSVYVSSYWLAHSHVPVTGSLIGSQPVIFHSNRQQMKCLCYMQRCCLVIIQEELWPFAYFPLYISLLSLLFLSISVPRLLFSFNLALFPPDSTTPGFFPPSFAFSLHACFLVLCKLGWKWKINLWRWEASLMSSVPLAPVLFWANHCITILFNGSI